MSTCYNCDGLGGTTILADKGVFLTEASTNALIAPMVPGDERMSDMMVQITIRRVCPSCGGTGKRRTSK